MPPKGQSDGFKQRNQIVGNAWTSYSEEEQAIFVPSLFERLVQVVMTENNETHSHPPPPPPSTSNTPIPDEMKALTSEEKIRYIPIFKNLVNLTCVARDFKHGRLCRHSGKSHLIEKVGKEEIKKIVQQVRSELSKLQIIDD